LAALACTPTADQNIRLNPSKLPAGSGNGVAALADNPTDV
jgi:hypothetical protein